MTGNNRNRNKIHSHQHSIPRVSKEWYGQDCTQTMNTSELKNSKKYQNCTPAGILYGTWPRHLLFCRIRYGHYIIDEHSLTQQKQISAAATTLTSKNTWFRLKK